MNSTFTSSCPAIARASAPIRASITLAVNGYKETAEILRGKTIETIRSFGFDGWFFNIEFWLTDDSVLLTEVNGRSAACFGGIYHLALTADIESDPLRRAAHTPCADKETPTPATAPATPPPPPASTQSDRRGRVETTALIFSLLITSRQFSRYVIGSKAGDASQLLMPASTKWKRWPSTRAKAQRS